MANQQTLQGNWNEIKGKICTHWGQLTDDDLSQFHGEVDSLVGTIQRKTGEGREAIEKYLHELTGSQVRRWDRRPKVFASIRNELRRACKTPRGRPRSGSGRLRGGRAFRPRSSG